MIKSRRWFYFCKIKQQNNQNPQIMKCILVTERKVWKRKDHEAFQYNGHCNGKQHWSQGRVIYWFPSVEVRQWDVVHLDFTIAFDSVCQERIVMKQRGRSLWAQPSLVKPHSATSQVRPFDSQPPTNPTAAATS